MALFFQTTTALHVYFIYFYSYILTDAAELVNNCWGGAFWTRFLCSMLLQLSLSFFLLHETFESWKRA